MNISSRRSTYEKQKKWADRKKKQHADEHRRKLEAMTRGLTFKPKLNTGKGRYKNVKSRLLVGTGLEAPSTESFTNSFDNNNTNNNIISPQRNKFHKTSPSNMSYSNSQSNYINIKKRVFNDVNASSPLSQRQQQEIDNINNLTNNNNMNMNNSDNNVMNGGTNNNNNNENKNNDAEDNDNNNNNYSSISGSMSSFYEHEAMQSHVARQLEARRRKESIANGTKFKVKKSALKAKPFNLSRSNLPFASQPVTMKTATSQQELCDRITNLEKEIELLKIKHSKETILIRNETLMKNEIALKDQAELMMKKHQEERSNWHVERAKLLTLLDALKNELLNREETKRKAEELSSTITSTFDNLSQHMLTIEKHSVEELRLLRAKVGGHNNNSSTTSSLNSSSSGAGNTTAVDVETLRGLLRSLEKNIRRLMLGREESSGKQVKRLENHLEVVQTAVDEKRQEDRKIDSKRFLNFEKNLTSYQLSTRENHSLLMKQMRDMNDKIANQYRITLKHMPEIESKLKTLVINNKKEDRNRNENVDEINFDDSKIIADGQEQAQQVEQQGDGGDGNNEGNNKDSDVDEYNNHQKIDMNVETFNKNDEVRKNVGNVFSEESIKNFENNDDEIPQQITELADVDVVIMNNNNNEEEQGQGKFLGSRVEQGGEDNYNSDEFENDEDEDMNNKSYDSYDEGSQQSNDRLSSNSDLTNSSLDTWIEVNQSENKGGTFYYNRKTREVRKEKPAEDE